MSTNKFTRRIAASALALTAAFSLAACGGSGTASTSAHGTACEKEYTVGFSHPVGEAASIKTLKFFVKQQAEANGCVKLLLDSTTASNLESQRSTVESWVTQKVDAIVVWPADVQSFEGLRHQAQAQGTKWLTYASPIDGQDGSVGFDSDKAGELIAKDVKAWVAKNYPNGGATASVTTLVALPSLAGRWEKPLAALKEAGIKVVSQQDCGAQTCGLQVTEDALIQNKNLRIFIGSTDETSIGTLRAVKNAGIDPKTVYIAGYDGSEEALKALEANDGYKASAAIPLKTLGYSVIDNAMAAITGKGNSNGNTDTVLATPEETARIKELTTAYAEAK